jgi:hypothetical protein
MTPGRIWALAVAAAAMALAGCTAKSVSKDYEFKAAGKGEGLVVFSVSHDRIGRRGVRAIAVINGGPVNGGYLAYSIDDDFFGGRNEFKDRYGHVIALALPAGKHQFDGWRLSTNNVHVYPREKPPPLQFEVAPGQIKYLGNLHGNVEMGKNLFGMSVLAGGHLDIRDERQRDLAMFDERYPQFKGKAVIELLPQGPWLVSLDTLRTIDYTPVVPVPAK